LKQEENSLILIVDDTPHNLQVAGEILGREGYGIALAQGGVQALEFVERQKPDLILLDIMMPEIDGFKVCQTLKENIETRSIPVIFLTARAQVEDIVRGFELGGADYLVKPFNDRELVARVRSHLELVRLQEILRSKNRKLVEEIRLRKQREKDFVGFEHGAYMGVMIGNIAHEFNNLLQVILGFGELVAEKIQEDVELSSLQGSVLEAGRKASRFVGQLMSVAERKNRRKVETIEVVSFLEDRMSLFRSIFPEYVTFDLHLPEAPVYVNADCGELALVLTNLFLNSNRAVKEGGRIVVNLEKVCVNESFLHEHSLENGDEFVRMAVKDNGGGMESHIIEDVFDPFFSFHKDNSIGIGLSVVKAIIKKLGGVIEIESNRENGTCFVFYLPSAKIDSESGKNGVRPTAFSGNGELILLAEDELHVINFEKRILEKAGYKVITACDGEEAIRVFKENANEVSMVLMDIGLPKKSGIQVGKEIASISPDTPVVYCTAYNDKRFEEMADIAVIIQKPFERDEILHLIKKTIVSNA
jgi:DNA-binding response OmpR family regulator